MLNLKKTATAVLALVGSSAVFAGTMGPVCTPGNVTVPCESTAWDFGVQALYLKPAYSGFLGYIGTNTSNVSGHAYERSLDWGWGFRLEGSYHFNTGNDLTVNWLHYGKSTDFTYVDEDTSLTNYGYIKPRFDAVNVEFGQHVDFGEMKDIRFHGGVQWARVRTSIGQGYASNNYGSALNLSMNGFGPRVGADMTYNFGNGFAVYGNGATAILVGTSKTNGLGVGVDRSAIVPAVEAKLGAKYNYAMAQGDLTLDAGWMFVNYFNAQSLVPGFDSDFGLQGPYVGLKWIGNV